MVKLQFKDMYQILILNQLAEILRIFEYAHYWYG